jgi:type I restriction enzyme S subunit
MSQTTTTNTFQKYPAYKDSGVEWLGEIPEHWDTIRIKHLFKEINERSFDGSEDLLSVSQYTGVTNKTERLEEGGMLTTASTLEGYKKVRKNDLVSNIMLAWNGSLGFSPFDGITSPAYSIYRLKSNDIYRYFHYLFRTELYKSEFKRNSSGVIESRLRLYTDDFFRIESILPPLEEQSAIAAFLDEKTAKIELAIAQKEKMIALLKERKQIIIQNAVTKGLDPNVKMKDSGVEWIGEVPEGWEVESLKNILIERNKKNSPIQSIERLSLSIDKGVTLYSEKTTNLDRFKDDFTQYKLAYKNDLVFNSMNMIVGAVGISNYFGCVSPVYYTFYSLLDNPKITKYYEHFFKIRIVQSQLFCLGKGIMAIDRGDGKFNTVRLKVSRNDLHNMKVTFPSIFEIEKIVDYIELVNSKTDKTIKLQEQQIEKLKEYKSILIDSAVTGKIRVG